MIQTEEIAAVRREIHAVLEYETDRFSGDRTTGKHHSAA